MDSENMIRIGIICPSEIAFRRFLPALRQAKDFQYIGVAYATPEEWFGDKLHSIGKEQIENMQTSEAEKAQKFVDTYGGKVFRGYAALTTSDEIDAAYIPLPPALHFRWARQALLNGKHVLVEKPSTTSLADTEELVRLAQEKSLALHENYMFVFHKQLEELTSIIDSREIGEVRLYRISFGFPRRDANDFRYNRSLGGGALLDAGGYTIKLASYLLGPTSKVVTASANYIPSFEVDMYGSATMVNDKHQVAQLAFGMDNDYQCKIEIWGSKGTIVSDRILTAPAGFHPSYTIKKNQDISTYNLPDDDAFLKSILRFEQCILEDNVRIENYSVLLQQERLVEQFKEITGCCL